MSRPKGKVPLHIKFKEFYHPQANDSIIHILIEIKDPRKPSCNFQRSLVKIIFITLVGLLCGAKDWEEIVYRLTPLLIAIVYLKIAFNN